MRRSKRYAPLWVILFSAGAALARAVGQRFILRREWKLTWKDAMSALTAAVGGYIFFRTKYGNQKKGVLTR